MKRIAMTTSLLQRLQCVTAAVAVSLASAPVMAAAPAKGKKPAGGEAAPATDGRTVALMRFTGPPKATEIRGDIQTAFDEKGFKVKGVALDVEAAAKKVKCGADASDPACLEALGKWLNSNPKTAADYIVFGSVSETVPPRANVVVYDIADAKVIKEIEPILAEQDLILPIALPQEVATAIEQDITPPGPPTEEEQEILAQLDEPEKTPEELAAEKEQIAQAQEEAARAQQAAPIDTSTIEVDLRDDFQDFCRTGPRRKRESKDDPKDLRPKCSLGPVFGYWQPRAWVALGLTAGAALGTLTFYSLALAARGPYQDAKDDLDRFVANQPGDPSVNPNFACNAEGVCYDELATEVSKTGATMRRRAIVGDVLAGTTVLLGGVLAIIIWQDRSDAKNFIKQEKGLKAISDLNVGPIITKDSKGLGMSFRF